MSTETPIENITASCHCGDISVTVKRKPEYINVCQCKICNNYGAEWGYYQLDEAPITKREGADTKKYVYGDRKIEFHFCANCGCVMYWYPIYPDEHGPELGLNTRMIKAEDLKKVEKRWMYDTTD